MEDIKAFVRFRCKGASFILIRTMGIGDYENVHRLWLCTPGVGLNDVDDSQAGIQSYLKRNPATCFVAEEDGEVVGAILAGHDGRRGYIYHTTVKASARNRGIGGKLTEAALKALDKEGISKVALVVFKRNEIGNAFWENRGFGSRDDLVYRNKALKALVRHDT